MSIKPCIPYRVRIVASVFFIKYFHRLKFNERLRPRIHTESVLPRSQASDLLSIITNGKVVNAIEISWLDLLKNVITHRRKYD